MGIWKAYFKLSGETGRTWLALGCRHSQLVKGQIALSTPALTDRN
jgi:hypothetical protein